MNVLFALLSVILKIELKDGGEMFIPFLLQIVTNRICFSRLIHLSAMKQAAVAVTHFCDGLREGVY